MNNSGSDLVMDIARYTAADPDRLIERHPIMIAALRDRFPGFVDARLAQGADGIWIDIITWDSTASAQAAVKGEPLMPEYRAFADCIDSVEWSGLVAIKSRSGSR